MGLNYVFRVQGTEYEGMRMPSGLYHTIISTIETFQNDQFPFLLGENTYQDRFIDPENIESFKQELDKAGSIILRKPLVNVFNAKNSDIVMHENKFTTTQAGITLATMIELCDQCLFSNKGIKVNMESASPNHINLSYEKKLEQRLSSCMYPIEAKNVKDYRQM